MVTKRSFLEDSDWSLLLQLEMEVRAKCYQPNVVKADTFVYDQSWKARLESGK